MGGSAYLAGLTLLARRELSTAQLRQRLARRGYAEAEIEEALSRLAADRSLDDARTAGAIARTAIAVHGHGRLRVRRQLESAGIAAAIADQALEEAFAAHDADALLEAALDRRLRGGASVEQPRDVQRLYRYLVGRGFEPDRVLRLLRSRRP